MTYVELPSEDSITEGSRPLPFYLAMEEFVARHQQALAQRSSGVPLATCSGATPINLDGFLFLWRVRPTVICGRNQEVVAEVDIDYCRGHGINVVGRKSGGGAVYADMDNVMVSYVTHGDAVGRVFTQYLAAIVGVLRGLGVAASFSQHNDIMIGERKVSGNAFRHIPAHVDGQGLHVQGVCVVHGTLLYDTDMENMRMALTPSDRKLAKHGVRSVPQRICLLKDYVDIPLDGLMAHLRRELCGDNVVCLDGDDVDAIGEMARRDYFFMNNQSTNQIV